MSVMRDLEKVKAAKRRYVERYPERVREAKKKYDDAYKKRVAEKKRAQAVVDYTGKRFGALVTLDLVKPTRRFGHGIWRCKCDCGNECEVSSILLNFGKCTSCGCGAHRHAGVRRAALAKVGQRFGKLVAMKIVGMQRKQSIWELRCDCGNTVNMTLWTAARRKKQHCGGCGIVKSSTGKGFNVELVTNKVRMKRFVLNFPPKEAQFLKVLRDGWPNIVPHDTIISTLWPNNEPDTAQESIKTFAHKVRNQLRTIGVAVVSHRDEGYRLVIPE